MTGKRELIKTAFIKSLPIMCSYIFVSMAYGITMEEHRLAWYYSLLISATVYVALLSIVLGTGACMLLLLADSLYF